MSNDPALILADEPTGALDTKTGRVVMDIFHKLHKSGKTIVLITHSPELAKETERIITISDGSIISDTGSSLSDTVSYSFDQDSFASDNDNDVSDAGGESNDAY